MKGLGAAVSLPMLESMSPVKALASATTQPPVRMAFMFVPNGVHLQEWKKYWRITESKIMYANEGRRPQEVKDPAPNCVDLGTTRGFFIGPGGFTCGERPRLWEWLQG